MTVRRAAWGSVLAGLISLMSGETATAQLSIEEDWQTPSAFVLPVWVTWTSPDGTVSHPCGPVPVVDLHCVAWPVGFARGVHRLHIVESIGRESHRYEIPASGTEVQVEILLARGRAQVREYRAAAGMLLRENESATLVLVNATSSTCRLTAAGGDAIAHVDAFSMLSGWEHRFVTDLEGAFISVDLRAGEQLPARIEPPPRSLAPTMHRARVHGEWQRAASGSSVEILSAWVSESYVFHGTGRSGGPFRL